MSADSPGEARASGGGAAIDFVTVVFSAELPLLVLQARSIARHVDADALGAIVLILNDPDEAACRRALEGLRGEYGRFADRVRIVSPTTLLDEPDGLRARLRAAWVAGGRTRFKARLRRRRRRDNPAGWCGNNGWSMQQAFKLLCAPVCSADHIVFLDAKNHFLRAADAAHFVAADGRARTRALTPDAKQRSWVEASFAALGLAAPPPGEVPPTVTPFAIERAVLAECTARLAERLGPLECFFALRRGRATEFMLLYAALDGGEGRWWRLFAEGLPASVTVFRPPEAGDPDDAAMLEAVRALRREPALIAGVHRTRLAHLDGEVRRELLGLWSAHGLIAGADELERLFPAPSSRTVPSRAMLGR